VTTEHSRNKIGIADKLLSWFQKNRRDFPWRRTFENPDPYVILFTEIMLQRTKANQVAPLYLEFFRKYPTFAKLKQAARDEVIELFARLGLQWRARRVWDLVTFLDQEHQGKIPRELKELEKLPGVGTYVARAVSCYAFGDGTAPVDSNVVRVISRVFGIVISSDTGRRSKKISGVTTSLIPIGKERDFNLALLDFAALVCKPRPLCAVCPLQDSCKYYESRANVSRIPLKSENLKQNPRLL